DLPFSTVINRLTRRMLNIAETFNIPLDQLFSNDRRLKEDVDELKETVNDHAGVNALTNAEIDAIFDGTYTEEAETGQVATDGCQPLGLGEISTIFEGE
ncbi:MAG: hypothetical protein J5915_05985, partial [Acidaminococcaceae bacterium]|nr:hypothetical protein [Acidaminococcaceae bacterium]